MATLLNGPLNDRALSNQEIGFMQRLQANILKGHGREHVALLFLRVHHLDNARAFLRSYPVSDAHTQLKETKEFKETGVRGGVVRLVFLSRAGLAKFGHNETTFTTGVFNQPMAADAEVLDNGATDRWQPELLQPPDALLLVAHHDPQDLARIVGKLAERIGADLTTPAAEAAQRPFEVLFIQEGRAYKNDDGEGIEHFGYVDGRSQPLMLDSEIAAEKKAGEDFVAFNPKAPLGQFVLPDPLDPQGQGHGSFFVFRKLEQNVAAFKAHEKALADKLQLLGDPRERAGAMAVGRFEDGTPAVLAATEEGVPVINDFDYRDDVPGARCPFHGHIRKTHPRGSSPGGPAFDHGVQMARRGITYGARLQDPGTGELIDRPNDGVGLLFMSYQASIDKQFHFMQTKWANNEDFPAPGVGLDPLIGQRRPGVTPVKPKWFPTWGGTAGSEEFPFDGFVTLKGGEYFFAPSVSGLKLL